MERWEANARRTKNRLRGIIFIFFFTKKKSPHKKKHTFATYNLKL